ncbi:hypothetical protein RND81_08G145400 [Saponaria officinalis]|uniref:Post-GPI attachment to proteins factor 3 n=1 Tax=Saponaria officinalis TaxID=3572 RepID=A0AAW1J7Z4_SAPOF
MGIFHFLLPTLLFLGSGFHAHATAGDSDPIYMTCVEKCKKTGCIQEQCFNSCNVSLSAEAPWYFQEPLYIRWKEWDCLDECRYHCMVLREAEREKRDDQPVKYHGKWPFRRVFGIQEPVSVAVSMLNLALIFHGWLSFFILLHYKLPMKPSGKTYYEYTGLWHVYAILSMNSWFWSVVFHSRYLELTEKLYYSSTLAFLGFILMISVIRALNITTEAARVMVAAPVIAFVTTHILFLNVVQFDYEWNLGVVAVLATTQLVFWTIYGIRSCQPSRWKLWFSLLGSALAMLLEIIDFPPYKGFIDSHASWQATSIPITYIWWSFIKDDAEYTTAILTKKAK